MAGLCSKPNCRSVVDKDDSTSRAAAEAEHTTHCIDWAHLPLQAHPGHCSPGATKAAASSHPCMQLLPKLDFKRLPPLHALEIALKLQISLSSHLTAMHLSHESALEGLINTTLVPASLLQVSLV